MNDVILTTGEDVNLTIVGGPTLKFLDVITITNAFDYDAYYNSLSPYASDEAAILGGLSVGDKYRTTDNHVSLPGGVIKTIMTI
jgi:hypothetical protein